MRATYIGPPLSEIISHAAPTVCMKAPMSETTFATSRLRKVVDFRGCQRLVDSGTIILPKRSRSVWAVPDLKNTAIGDHRFRKVPSSSSSNACRNCSWVFITIGPYQATGSPNGLPETRRNRIPSGPAGTSTSSPRSKTTSERLSAADGGAVSSHAIPSVGLDRQAFSLAGANGDVKIYGIRGYTIYRTLLSPEAPVDDA